MLFHSSLESSENSDQNFSSSLLACPMPGIWLVEGQCKYNGRKKGRY